MTQELDDGAYPFNSEAVRDAERTLQLRFAQIIDGESPENASLRSAAANLLVAWSDLAAAAAPLQTTEDRVYVIDGMTRIASPEEHREYSIRHAVKEINSALAELRRAQH